VHNSGPLESLPQRWSKRREDPRSVCDILKHDHVLMWLEECEAGYGEAGDGRFVDGVKVQDFELGIRVRRNRRDREQFLVVKTLYIRQHVYSVSGTTCMLHCLASRLQVPTTAKRQDAMPSHSKCY
jgi:hypothetical protein